jgi:hypothetical protein
MRLVSALLLLGVLAGAGCGGSESPRPEAVTADFWEAIRARDIEAAGELASEPSRPRLERMRDGRPIDEVLIGETLIGEHSAVVRTSLATSVNEGRVHTTFDTHLVRRNSGWAVDTAATERALTTALFTTSIQQISEAVGQGVEEFSGALAEGAAEVSRAIREALEEFERNAESPK